MLFTSICTMYKTFILFIVFICLTEKKLNLFCMEENKLIAPNDLFLGRKTYTDAQFRNDVCNIHNWHLLEKKDQDSLNALVDNIIYDMKTNNEPDDFLKNGFRQSDGMNVRVGVAPEGFELVAEPLEAIFVPPRS